MIIVLLLICILLCMFKTVRMFVGLIIILMWWNWPAKAEPFVQKPNSWVTVEKQCHWLAIDAVAAFSVGQHYTGDVSALLSDASKYGLSYKAKSAFTMAEAKAIEYLSHPECTADKADMLTILK